MNAMTEERILDDLTGMLRNFYGREYSGEINMQTRLGADVGMASIDAVVLGETIEEHYGRKIPFNEFMAELGRRQARDIELGELVRFLHNLPG
jgi:acyl carrier protein